LDLVLLIARLGLAATFAVAAAGKLVDFEATRRTLAEFGAPDRLTPAGALALPAVELAVAVLLIPNATARLGALLALVLLAVFVAAIIRSLARGRQPDCNCFGGLHSAPIGPLTLVRNLALAAVAGLVVATGPGESLGALDGGTVLAVASALAALLLLGVAWFSWQLFKQNGRLLARIRALEEVTGISQSEPPRVGGLPVGEPTPDLVLATPGGGRRSVLELVAPGSPVALVFSDPSCGGCKALTERLPALKAELDGVLEPVLVTRGMGLHADSAAERGLNVLIQEDREALVAFRLGAVPSAVIVGGDGRIASSPAVGEEAIEGLLRTGGPAPLPDLNVIDILGAGR
jgi:uncharacterized membrane protein YphA (DoxX/SURF4 family)